MRFQVWCHLQGVFEDDENIHLVMELCAGGGNPGPHEGRDTDRSACC